MKPFQLHSLVRYAMQRSIVLPMFFALALYLVANLGAPGNIAYAAGTYTGTVFIDYDNDGVQDANEPAQSGIAVALFDVNGNRCTTTTNSSGVWSINSSTCGGLSAGPYRVEFTIPASFSYFQPGAVGTGNSTSVVFVADGGATVNFGLMSPDEYAGAADVPLVTSNNSNPGASSTKTSSTTNPSVLAWPYNATAPSTFNPNDPDPTRSISFSGMGSTWGLGIQRSNLRAYFSAALVRHVDLGPAARPTTGAGNQSKAVDGVYMVDMSSTSGTLAGYFTLNGVSPANGNAGAINLGSVTRKIITTAVDTTGTTGTNQDLNALSTTNAESFDRDAFGKVATVGFGGAEVSSDDKYLWLVNLNQKSLIRVDITNYSSLPTGGSTPSASLVSHYTISTSGLSACGSGGTYRPWGLKLYRGRGYVGITCDVLNAQGTADAWVRSFDLNDPTAGFTTEVSIDLSRNTSGGASGYSREQTNNTVNTNTTFANRWNDWLNSFDARTGIAYETTGTNWEASRPQALIGDIEFTDSGDMVIGMLDRFGMQSGFLNYSTNPADDTSGSQQLYSANAGGDLIHACRSGSSYIVEGFSGCTIDNDTGPQSGLTNDGPNSVGEYYYDDYAYFGGTVTHFEVASGGLAVRRSTTEVVSTVFDPVRENANYQQGVRWFDTNTSSGNSTRGTALRSYQAWPVSGGNTSKANGLGDIEQLNVAPLELGNRVWRDDDGDGIQDPNEMAVAGVTVQLLRGGNVVGTAVTNSKGEYYFTSTPGTNDSNTSDNIGQVNDSSNGILRNTAYVVRINPTVGNNAALLSGLNLTTANASDSGAGDSGANADARDSDATLSSSNYEISLTTGGAGANNHTSDFGFTPLGAIGNRVWLDEDSNGYQDEGEDGLPNITVQLKNSGGTVIATTYTDANGNYLFKDLPAGSYFVQVLSGSVPTGLSQTTTYPNNGADLFNQNQSSGNGYAVTLSAGQENLTADFGYNWNPTSDVTTGGAVNATAALGDRVWIDINGNGYQDPFEVGVRGATVTLYYAAQNDGVYDDVYNVGGYTPTRTTDSNGNYMFDGLPPGAYVVQVTSDSGASHAILTAGQYNQTGDPEHWGTTGTNNDNKTTTPVVLGPGDVFLNADFGYQPNGAVLGSIGNFVWFDRDADGVGPNVDADGAGSGSAETHGASGTADSEEGIGGVSVSLIRDTNGNGVWDSGEPIIATQFTSDGTQDVDGDGNVDAKGAYRFRGLQLTDGSGSDDYLVWVNDTNRVLDGLRATYDKDGSSAPSSGVVTGLGISAVTNLGTTGGTPYGTNDATDQDFGYTGDGSGQRTSSAVLTSPTNSGVIGDRVWLDINNNAAQDSGELGIPGVRVNLYDSSGGLVATTLTGADGYYLFPNLPTSAGGIAYTVKVDTTTLPGGLTQTYDATNPTTDSTSTVTLTNAAPSNLLQDFGYRGTGTVGNLVWKDLNANGVYQANGADGVGGTEDDETGISGVTLDIYFDTNRNGKIDPGEPKLGTTTTDANGAYSFSGLPTNDGSGSAYYVVDVTDNKGILAGYWHSLGTAGSDNNSQTDPYGVSISPGSPDNLTADFGYYPKFAALGNYVFNDANANGIQDSGEVGINGVVVQLTITYPNGTTTTLYTTTGDDPNTNGTQTGWYSFGNLLQDENYNTTGGSGPTFSISVVTADNTGALANLVKTNIDQGANDKTDADNPAGVSATALKGVTTVSQNATANNESTIASYDFGYTAPVNLGDRIWYDTNNNGTLDAGEAGINGVTVRLYRDTNGNGTFDSATDTLVATTTTANASGNDGTYNFTLLTPSIEATISTHYFVVLPDTNFTSGGALASYLNSSSTVSANSDTNNADHGRVIGTLGQSGGYVVTQNAAGNNSGAVSVTLGGEPTNDGDGNNGNLTLDFGFYRLTASGKVWLDNGAGGGTSNNGMLDGSEGGLNSVRVELYKNGVLVAVAFTNSSGDYSFTQQTDSNGNGNNRPLQPGSDYTISIPSGQNVLGTLKSSADVSTTTNPTNTGNGVQTDDNGVGTDPGSSTITTSTFTLGATGTSNTAGSTFTNSNGTTSQPTIYFGFAPGSPTSIDLGQLTAQANDDGSITIEWETLNESNILGFNVLRSERKNSEQTQVNTELVASESVGEITGNVYTFTDTGVATEKKYFYRLEIVRPNGENEFTEPVSVTTTAGACSGKPNVPTLAGPEDGKKVKKGKVTFTWNPVECAASYKWQLRGDASDGESIASKKDLTTTQTSIKKLQPGRTYYWRVQACNAAGKCSASEWSSIVVKQPKEKQKQKTKSTTE